MRIQRPDGSERVVSGYKEKEHEGIDDYAPGALGAHEVPPSVDLRPHLTPVEDQGDTNSCVANAVAGAYEYLTKQHTGRDYDVSRMFIYYNARRLEADDVEDEGTSIGDAIHSLKKYGACAEDTWPFDKGHVNHQPEDPAYDEAAHFIVDHTEKVPTELDTWRHCLAEGRPIIFGLTLYNSFDRARKGKVPMPTDTETARGKHGKHAMLAVGYSDSDGVFIIRNSWGASWGDSGYCYIPYDYVMDDKLNSGDSWVIRQLEGTPAIDRSVWGDDASILPTLDAELHKMGDDDYQIMLEALGDVPLETRLALVYLAAASSDGDLSDAEGEAVAAEVFKILQQLGSDHDAVGVLTYALRHLKDEALIDDSIALLGAHLSRGMLASILASMKEIASADGETEDEQSFIEIVTSTWEVGGSDSGAETSDGAAEGEDTDANDDAEDDDDDDDDDEEDEDDKDEDSGN